MSVLRRAETIKPKPSSIPFPGLMCYKAKRNQHSDSYMCNHSRIRKVAATITKLFLNLRQPVFRRPWAGGTENKVDWTCNTPPPQASHPPDDVRRATAIASAITSFPRVQFGGRDLGVLFHRVHKSGASFIKQINQLSCVAFVAAKAHDATPLTKVVLEQANNNYSPVVRCLGRNKAHDARHHRQNP